MTSILSLPIEILHEIASTDIHTYRSLLSIPAFARDITPGKRIDYMVLFGFDVRVIKKYDYIYLQWTLNGKPHRADGPAAEYPSGTKIWYINGKTHRTNGPAVEYPNGSKIWYNNGKPHRTDGPAEEYPDGTKYWYINGKLHRIDGPAIEYPNGSKEWCINGKRHRADGPAVIRANGSKEWWINGIRQPSPTRTHPSTPLPTKIPTIAKHNNK